jgi:D-psicose/D-tagatose/L-ribulose 3-epimerase
MMKIGVSAFAWTGQIRAQHLALLPQLKQMGIDAFEIPMVDPRNLPVADIRAAFNASGVDCTVCALLPQEMNPISPDPAIRQAAILHLRRCIHTAAETGASLLGGPLFAPIGYLPAHRSTRDEWQWAVEAFASLQSDLDDTGLALSIEPVNRSETFFLRTASDAVRLCDAVGNSSIGITIDTFHANIEELSTPSSIRAAGSHVKHIHLSESDRGPLGRGHIQFDQIIRALRDIDYDGYLLIEGFGYDEMEVTAPGWLWADTSVSPIAMVRESLVHLHTLGV